MKSFETGLRDDILAANLRSILRLSELTAKDLMRHVSELASHQAERQSKLACERRSAKCSHIRRRNYRLECAGQQFTELGYNVEEKKKTKDSQPDEAAELSYKPDFEWMKSIQRYVIIPQSL